MAKRSAPAIWQPPGWSPPGAVAFLKGLVDDNEALQAWAAGRPGAAWGEWLVPLGLAPYAWHRLKSSGCAGSLAAELSQVLRNAYYASVGDAELHATELREVLACLAAAGVTPVLFKGAALAYGAYPDPACRLMGDLDLWLTDEQMRRARAALTANGYREHGKTERPLEMQRKLGGEVQLVGTRPGQGLIELHWGMFAGEWLRRTAAVDDAGIRCRAQPAQVAGCDAWVLAPEDAALQLIAHLAINHQMGFPGVRGLLDLALLARASGMNWAVVAERGRAWRLGTPTWLVLSLTGQLIGLDGAERAVAALAPSASREARLRRFVDAEDMLAGRDITGGPRRLIFQLLLVDRTRDAMRLVGRTLWPEAEWLMARYGSAGPNVRARHLAQAMQGHV